MFDTVGIDVPNNGKMNFDHLDNTGNYTAIRNLKKRINKSVIYYTYKNFLIEKPVNESDTKPIRIYGSIQKIVNNQNFTPNTIEAIRNEVKEFSDVINIDLFSQQLVRVDLCKDYQTELVEYFLENIYPVEKYYKRVIKKSLYFEKWQSKKYLTVCFYDKAKEMKQFDKSILRHEVKLYKPFLTKKGIYTLNDIFDRLNELETLRGENMQDFKVTERKPINLTGTKRDLILRAREIGIKKIMNQIKDECDRKLICPKTYYNRIGIIKSKIHLIENQEFEMLKQSEFYV